MNAPQARILLVDDDATLTDLLGDYLRQAGYQVQAANSARQALEQFPTWNPDLVVLDVMMPHTDGWQVLGELRRASRVPVIMLTAKEQEVDKLRAFRAGADDYVTKPFSFAELAARIGAVLNRARGAAANASLIETGHLSIDLIRRRVYRKGQAVELTPTEFRLLEVLVRHYDTPLPSEELVRRVWGPAYEGEVEHVKHYIWALRRKLEEDPGDPKHLITERGYGYRFT
jgi:two-component system KDP operon response regulator KdpE